MPRRYAAAVARLSAAAGTAVEEATPELRMRAVGQVGLLKACNGAEVMSMMMSSERVHSDLLDWLWYGEPEQVGCRGFREWGKKIERLRRTREAARTMTERGRERKRFFCWLCWICRL